MAWFRRNSSSPPPPKDDKLATRVAELEYTPEHSDSVLGAGGYGKVFRGRHSKTGEPVAVKVVSLKQMSRWAICEEIKFLDLAKNHPHVCQMFGYAEERDHFLVVMELAEKGELFTRVISSGTLTEPVAQRYFRHILGGVAYLHSIGIAHRDLKLENVLLASGDCCKICDFGLAHLHKKREDGRIVRETLKDVCGSKSYIAPEVLAGRGYDGFQADCWSIGVCLFAMLGGFFPLDEATAKDWRYTALLKETARGASATHTIFGFYSRTCGMSAHPVALIDWLMCSDTKKRWSVRDALRHDWIRGGGGKRPSTFMGRAGGADDEMDVDLPSTYRGQRTDADRRSKDVQEAAIDSIADGVSSLVHSGKVLAAALVHAPQEAPGKAPPLARQEARGQWQAEDKRLA